MQCVEFTDVTTLSITVSDKNGNGVQDKKVFTFDSVFPPQSTQEEVFEETESLLESVLDGYNVCVFAYGQTGSGKTFTMSGSETLPGLTPRCMSTVFRRIHEIQRTEDVKVSSYFLELYNDQLVDLYYKVDHPRSKDVPKLDIKVDASKNVVVKNAVVKPITSLDELQSLFEEGNAQRHVGSTKMNAESSRSHSVFCIIVEVYHKATKKTSTAKLSLIDLAGSERAGKTGATKAQVTCAARGDEEGRNIFTNYDPTPSSRRR